LYPTRSASVSVIHPATVAGSCAGVERYPDLFPPRLAESFAEDITAAAGARMRTIRADAEPGPAQSADRAGALPDREAAR
jgi:hypothetical protein